MTFHRPYTINVWHLHNPMSFRTNFCISLHIFFSNLKVKVVEKIRITNIPCNLTLPSCIVSYMSNIQLLLRYSLTFIYRQGSYQRSTCIVQDYHHISAPSRQSWNNILIDIHFYSKRNTRNVNDMTRSLFFSPTQFVKSQKNN